MIGLLAIGLGGAFVTGLVAWFGARTIGVDVMSAGWILPGAVAIHSIQLFLSALAWRSPIKENAPRLGRYFRIRWIRESVNSLLPVAQLGGNIVGIRLLTLRGLSAALAAASTTLDLTVEALTQLLFTIAGISTIGAIGAGHEWGIWLDGSLAFMAIGLIGFVVAQRIGVMRIVEVLALRLNQAFPSLSIDGVQGLHDELMRLQTDHAALLRATALHSLAWLMGVAETSLMLWAMGSAVSVPEALVIESLGMAARSAGFIVPGALGVQETGFILVCQLLGISADTAIALSMLKRARELLVGLPGLIAWQWTEGRRMLRRNPALPSAK